MTCDHFSDETAMAGSLTFGSKARRQRLSRFRAALARALLGHPVPRVPPELQELPVPQVRKVPPDRKASKVPLVRKVTPAPRDQPEQMALPEVQARLDRLVRQVHKDRQDRKARLERLALRVLLDLPELKDPREIQALRDRLDPQERGYPWARS